MSTTPHPTSASSSIFLNIFNFHNPTPNQCILINFSFSKAEQELFHLFEVVFSSSVKIFRTETFLQFLGTLLGNGVKSGAENLPDLLLLLSIEYQVIGSSGLGV